ncbi:bifunctional precorrin-2 dehydrogenase/sirohydrochlorin ferrochelatase [Shewanella sp. AS1]|uniref:precorrin-2 dehydrogenase/sirohydrochlorin ferrochelatase family protein n=1 Tax=Shewanella sp. AS1 TaxID=2907626 RepID=UPI001F2EF49E|nr:bifunctional precorrin-2 dehydrogenase/sirohydrochlorin ferrochelatase [Shewanella sp. AS1]MCE9678707.1 bifunctional precorrin-2 dehydrogenase/sirohydrochlorin ferrochelatase [Shewanella sp. AS1]
MQYFPLFLDTQSIRVLMIGAGEVASRKLDLLTRTEADIRVIAIDVCDEVLHYHDSGRIRIVQRAASKADLQDCDLLYLATQDEAFNQEMALAAKEKGILTNVVDAAELCQFITPSIIDRGRLQVAISTAGAAPVYARELRARIETLLPASLAPLFDFVAERRSEVQQRLPNFSQRKLFWEQFFKANGDKFDANTAHHYANGFEQLSCEGDILLVDDTAPLTMLPIAAIPLLQRLDLICCAETIPAALLELCRRDAARSQLLTLGQLTEHYQQGERLLIYGDIDAIKAIKAHFPMAKHLRAGSF